MQQAMNAAGMMGGGAANTPGMGGMKWSTFVIYKLCLTNFVMCKLCPINIYILAALI